MTFEPLMTETSITARLRRFVLTSVPSVPYLEAMLLLRNEPREWTSQQVAQRLYMSEKNAHALLSELTSAGISHCNASQYRFMPLNDDLRDLIDELAAAYAHHLLEITHLIHSKIDRQAQQFADAFKLRKDS